MNWIKKPQLFLIGLFLLIGCAPEKNITHVHKHEKAENQLIDKSNGIKTPTDVIDSNKEVGTQVGGDYSGGAIDLMSSRFEVEQAIEEARKYFIETNLFYRIYKSQLFNARADKTLKQAFDVFINKDHYNGKVSYLKEIPLEEQYSIEVVKKTKIKLLDNLVCNIHNNESHTD